MRSLLLVRLLSVTVFLIGSAAAAWSQTVYYEISTGENYEKQAWHRSSAAAFKAAPPDNVYDAYTFERRTDGTSVVHRDSTTPSGDWRFALTYEYGRDGRLRKIRSEFLTFNGIASSGDNEGLTRCVRTFTVSQAGALHQTSERITDAKSGKVVARRFHQPQITPWMSLDQLPIRPKS